MTVTKGCKTVNDELYLNNVLEVVNSMDITEELANSLQETEEVLDYIYSFN